MEEKDREIVLVDLKKRQAVFSEPRKKVLIKVLAMGPIPGLKRKDREDSLIDVVHTAEATCQGLDPFLYRDKPDTGFCLFQREQGVRIDGIVEQLRAIGLVYNGGHWQMVQGKGPVNFLIFGPETEEFSMTKEVRQILGLRFNHATVWCNIKADGRLDTINLAKGRSSDEPACTLVVSGNSYELVNP